MKTIVLEEKEFFEKFYEVSGWTKENAPNMDNLYCLFKDGWLRPPYGDNV